MLKKSLDAAGGKRAVTGVDHVVRETVRLENRTLHLAAELVDARSDLRLWSKRFVGFFETLSDILDRSIRGILDGLQLPVCPRGSQGSSGQPRG